ncbi:nucleotide exchange factor GrpE [Parabacteroides sp. AM08-6]|uniref:nucleotide exchange factor GrpE n=1 Tax=Parabacteroides sp. AM08-6 TaxID=2292053 RepID=UPI000EFF55BF|nr:nucleotide exchange factor GrpE [Parabacteroides sp. AM08-6]RHJ83445.1 nucleotide exchange factor GrpE [Parabacteroides sp. AM08-6]
MSKINFNSKRETADNKSDQNIDDTTNLQEEQVNAAEETAVADNLTEELDELKKKYNELNDSHLRLMAEFDNYRKRTLREKADLIKNGGESALTHLLPVVDDFERALQNIRTAEDIKAVMEGVELIYSKFISYLAQQAVKPIETVGLPFDAETSEAVAMIPAPEPDMKGKVLDCVQTGYTLHDKVIRHAKVVVGE